MTDNDGFKLIVLGKRSSSSIDTVTAAVYVTNSKETQLNIKIGSKIIDTMSLVKGDRIELRYNRGTRQIKLTKGAAGYMLRSAGNFRRSINRVGYLEPFRAEALPSTEMKIVSLNAETVIVQIPEEIPYD